MKNKQETEEILFCDRQNGSKGKECKCTCHTENYPLPKDFPTTIINDDWKGGGADEVKDRLQNEKVGVIGYGKCSQCGTMDHQCGCRLEIRSRPTIETDRLWEVIEKDFEELFELNNDQSVKCKKHKRLVTQFEIKEFARYEAEKYEENTSSHTQAVLKEKVEEAEGMKRHDAWANGFNVDMTNGYNQAVDDFINLLKK